MYVCTHLLTYILWFKSSSEKNICIWWWCWHLKCFVWLIKIVSHFSGTRTSPNLLKINFNSHWLNWMGVLGTYPQRLVMTCICCCLKYLKKKQCCCVNSICVVNVKIIKIYKHTHTHIMRDIHIPIKNYFLRWVPQLNLGAT